MSIPTEPRPKSTHFTWLMLWLALVMDARAVGATRVERNPPVMTLGVGIGARAFDRLAESDPRPERRGEINAGVELGYRLTTMLRATALARFGGTFFDYDGSFASGNAPEQAWIIRAGVDWLLHGEGPISTYLGTGYEYGEARSWNSGPIEDIEGPRNYFTGVGVRAGLEARLMARTRLRCEVLTSVYYAHAFDERLDMRYRWLATASAATIGLDFELLRGRTATHAP